ncbi:YibE/F family protein [Amycolatopsis sp. NPDC051903]|uniref:YibE/F family protein n=1 Tax=Amycolatopsis sp. NPDC051903 TaxID=3363936 RepID=UPI0037A9678E
MSAVAPPDYPDFADDDADDTGPIRRVTDGTPRRLRTGDEPSWPAADEPPRRGRGTGETPLPPRRSGETPPPGSRRAAPNREPGDAPATARRNRNGGPGDTPPPRSRRTGDTPPPAARRTRTGDTPPPGSRRGSSSSLSARLDGDDPGAQRTAEPGAPADRRAARRTGENPVPARTGETPPPAGRRRAADPRRARAEGTRTAPPAGDPTAGPEADFATEGPSRSGRRAGPAGQAQGAGGPEADLGAESPARRSRRAAHAGQPRGAAEPEDEFAAEARARRGRRTSPAGPEDEFAAEASTHAGHAHGADPDPGLPVEAAPGKGLRAALAGTGHGHGHGHGHGPAAPASARVRKLLIWLLAPLALATVVGMIVLYPWGKPAPTSAVPQGTPVQASITSTATGPCLAQGQVQVGSQPDPDQKPCLTVNLTMTDGPANGKPLQLIVPIEPSTPRFSAGDAVVLAYNGGNATDPASFQLVDFQRGTPLLLLAGLFAIAVLVLGRWQGLAALVALVLSFVVIALFVLPSILSGENPLLVAIAGAGAIMFVALYLTHGLSARTSVAVLGTLVSLALIGILSAIFSIGASLTGLDDSTSTLIGSLGHGIDARGLLLAGVVIGALGVLDDVTVTQTSAVWELRRANPSLGWRELYRSGLRIGRDHVGSAVNTLVMAYAGAALPVLLYSSISGVGLGALLGSEDIASEIIRTLAGSVGIVAAVPVTTILAALIAAREPVSHLVSTTNTLPSHQ